MRRRLGWSRLALGIAALALPAIAFAQPPSGDEASTACTYTFTSGSGANGLTWCVSENGNLMMLETPSGKEHIRLFNPFEGYVLCSATTSGGPVVFDAADWGQAYIQWGAPVASGLTTSGVTITRATSDGRFRTVTKFSRNTSYGLVTVAVTVTNVSASKIFKVQYGRFADFNAGGSAQNDWLRTDHAVIAVESGGTGGVLLGTQTVKVAHATAVGGDPFNCGSTGVATPVINQDAMALVVYFLGDLAAGQSKTVKFIYKAP